MKKGLILEGGALRGLFTCGVIDVMMEHGIAFDGLVGVSAGSTFGCNYLSKQIGRGYQYNFSRGLTGWAAFKTSYAYDFETAYKNPMKFYATCSNIKTGKPAYKEFKQDESYNYEVINASAGLPILSKIVTLDHEKYLDGGITDSIPLKFMQKKGYNKNIVVLTQVEGFVKKQTPFLPLIKLLYRKYPTFLQCMVNRPNMYNDTINYIKEQENLGKVLVIRPPYKIPSQGLKQDPEKIKASYELGRKTALEMMEEIKSYLAK